jgi:hypothetical protein
MELGFGDFLYKVTACHLVSYSVVGMLAYKVMDYPRLFQTAVLSQLMRPVNSKWIALGPVFQLTRGPVLAAALYPFRRVFLETPGGLWALFGLLVGLSVLSTSGPSPGSLEGVFYTQLTWRQHLWGLPEVVLQNLAFCWLLVTWVRRPSETWTAVMSTLLAALVVASVAGALRTRPDTFKD